MQTANLSRDINWYASAFEKRSICDIFKNPLEYQLPCERRFIFHIKPIPFILSTPVSLFWGCECRNSPIKSAILSVQMADSNFIIK